MKFTPRFWITHRCSISTLYRILGAHDQVKERRKQVQRPPYSKPEFLATGPNQLWSWDITKLKSVSKWAYFYLYVIIDVFSRYVVGWLVAHREQKSLASKLIEESCIKQNISPVQLTVHADRGSSMESKAVAQLLCDLIVVKATADRMSAMTILFQKPSSKPSSTARNSPAPLAVSKMPGLFARTFSSGITPAITIRASA